MEAVRGGGRGGTDGQVAPGAARGFRPDAGVRKDRGGPRDRDEAGHADGTVEVARALRAKAAAWPAPSSAGAAGEPAVAGATRLSSSKSGGRELPRRVRGAGPKRVLMVVIDDATNRTLARLYFTAAAGVLAMLHPAWAARYGSMAKVITMQCANRVHSGDEPDVNSANVTRLPFLRTFDPGGGHSYAGGGSGLSPAPLRRRSSRRRRRTWPRCRSRPRQTSQSRRSASTTGSGDTPGGPAGSANLRWRNVLG